jgi:hypothetical protein
MGEIVRVILLVMAASTLLGCVSRPTKPLVLTEQMGALPVEFSAADCKIPLLSSPPALPYEVIARVKTYGNQGTGAESLHAALHREACALGAEAVILERLKAGEFQDEISVQHMGASTPRDYTSRADYEFQLVGLAIRYKRQK